MNDLTPSYEPDAGQVILEGRPAGSAGEAGLVPVAGVDLAFDRGDGHLVRVVADAGDQVMVGASGQAAATLLNRLFGPVAARVLDEVVASPAEPGAPRPQALSPEPVAVRGAVQPGPPGRGAGHQSGAAPLALVGGRGRGARRTGRPARPSARRG